MVSGTARAAEWENGLRSRIEVARLRKLVGWERVEERRDERAEEVFSGIARELRARERATGPGSAGLLNAARRRPGVNAVAVRGKREIPAINGLVLPNRWKR